VSIQIKTVKTKKDLRTFVKVPFKIFKGNPYWVPPLTSEELKTFDKKNNPAYKGADSRFFIAYKNGKPVGRIAGIISYAANEKYNAKNLRFGWFDTIEDYEVAEALFKEVEKWGKELGMETLTGPQGFSDLEPEGMLIEGFDQLPTIAVIYNHPYYPEFAEKYGFKKDADYVELKSEMPDTGLPEKLSRLAERIKERRQFKIVEFKKKKDLLSKGQDVFHLLNEAFAGLYGTVPLSQEQIDYYIKKYFSFVDKDLVKVVANRHDEVVGFVVTIPNLSKPFQKAKGRLLPFGWYQILKGFKEHETLDLYLIGVRKEYRGLGVDILMVAEIAKAALAKGFKYTKSNVILAENKKAQAQLKLFNPQIYRRKRIFKKKISL
jgi:ribosomal protein S18 acetylase RimI-like enzyme